MPDGQLTSRYSSHVRYQSTCIIFTNMTKNSVSVSEKMVCHIGKPGEMSHSQSYKIVQSIEKCVEYFCEPEKNGSTEKSSQCICVEKQNNNTVGQVCQQPFIAYLITL